MNDNCCSVASLTVFEVISISGVSSTVFRSAIFVVEEKGLRFSNTW